VLGFGFRIWLNHAEIYPGYIYIPEKSWIYPKYIPEYILNIFGMYSQIYLGFQGKKYSIIISSIPLF
jgi:hypothetical protein